MIEVEYSNLMMIN